MKDGSMDPSNQSIHPHIYKHERNTTCLEERLRVPAVGEHVEHQEDVLRRVEGKVGGEHGLADLFCWFCVGAGGVSPYTTMT
jgi:hypothetical protein